MDKIIKWTKELEDIDNLQQLLLRFRRVNIDNTCTVLDYPKRIALLEQGRMPPLVPYYFIDIHTENNSVFAVLTKPEVLKSVWHRRKNSIFYKEILLSETSAPVTVTPHALERYRQRSGTFMKEHMLWAKVVPQPQRVHRTYNTLTIRSDLMQPTFGGAWLGTVSAAKDGRIVFHYTHKHRHVTNKPDLPQTRFNALTWVPVQDMLPFQRAAWDAYLRNDAGSAVAIMSENVNKNQIDNYDMRNVNFINYDYERA